MLTREELETRALAEFAAAEGKLFRVTRLCGYIDDLQTEMGFEPPLLVRVVETAQESILHWNDDWLDPYWDVEVMDKERVPAALDSAWVDGPGRNLNGETEPARLEPYTGDWRPRPAPPPPAESPSAPHQIQPDDARYLTKEQLAANLHLMADLILLDDSYEGQIEYSNLGRRTPAGHYLVRGQFRFGNSQGQGGMRVLRREDK